MQAQPAPIDDLTKVKTIRKIARQEGLSEKRLRNAAHKGELRAFTLGTTWLWSTRAEVRRWVQSTQVITAEPDATDGGPGYAV